jgi:hypothetical protein
MRALRFNWHIIHPITANTTQLSASLGRWKYWNGDPLRTVEKALGMAEGMTYKGVHPIVKLVDKAYTTGIKLGKHARCQYEQALDRLPSLLKWFITIDPDKARMVCALAQNIE